MSLECAICRDSYGKLKQLKCRHAFCGHCLRKIECYGRIKCPYCRQDTQLTPFGVDHLLSQFGGRVQCTDCESDVPLQDGSWCAQCQSILCPGCSSSQGHEDHRLQVEPIDKSMAPVTYCVQQLDQLSAVHTRLTMMQKQLISEYVHQLGQAFERQLDDDLAVRLRMLKAEKQYLRQAFDLNSSRAGSVEDDKPATSTTVTSSVNQVLSSSSASTEEPAVINSQEPDAAKINQSSTHFASVLREVYKMSRTMGSGRMTSRDDLLPKHGKIFNPPTIDKMLDLCLENGRFASFSTSMKTLRKNQKNNPSGMIVRQTPPVNYFGSGILDDPCDLCVIPERNILLVTCVNGGIYSFVIDEAAEKRAETGKIPFKCYPPKVDNDQYAGISYDTENRYIVTTVLRNYHQWIAQIYERKGMRLRAETPCPTEPKIQNSWYRWVTCLGRGYALISTGDKRQSVIWLLNLHNHKWSVLLSKQNATFRKTSFHQSSRKWPENRQREGLVYVPDMKNKTIVTFLLDTHAWTISKMDEIRTTEFARELPITVNAKGGKLVVGYWNTGNVIFADLVKSTSITLTSVGPREIFSVCFLDTSSILILCKQREVVEMYKV